MKSILSVSVIRYLILAGLTAPVLRYISYHFTPFTGVGLRFCFGSIFLMFLAIKNHRKDLVYAVTHYKVMLIPVGISILVATNMTSFMVALSLSSSFAGTIFKTLGMPISIAMAALVYADERSRVMSLRFVTGLLVSFMGMAVFLSSNESSGYASPFFWLPLIVNVHCNS